METHLSTTQNKEAPLCDRVIFTPRNMYHEGILLDAAESTRDLFPGVDGEGIMNNHRIQALLDHPESTRPDAHYQDRIKVMFRMLKMVHDEWRSDVIRIAYPEDRTYTSILYRGGVGWELLVDMIEPNNVFVFQSDYSLGMQECLFNIVERHKKGEDIFGESGLEFLLPIYKDWKLPVIGVKKLIGFEYDKKHIFTRGDTKIEDSAIDGILVGDIKRVFGFDEYGRILDYSN